VVGDAAVQALLAHGQRVRLLSRHPADDARAWPERLPTGAGVETHDGDVTDPASLDGAARGCDVVLHLADVVGERPPELTFERVNVAGTRHVVDEAARAGAPRFVHVSSLGAGGGASPYHRSKRAGEDEAQRFPGAWTVVRLADVYGPGDAVVSRLLRVVRALPALPVLGGGIEFQPIWAGDAGEALARACERDDLAGAVLEVAGPERTSMRDLVDRFAELTGRRPLRVPVPPAVASFGVRAAGAVGVDLGVDEGQLATLAGGRVIDDPRRNALTEVLGVEPTPLDRGLRALLDRQHEQLPHEGFGALKHERYWADVEGARLGAAAMFDRFRRRFHAIAPAAMDFEAEPGSPTAVLALHQTLTMALPGRGHVQVRVVELGARSFTLQTLEGHPLAGAVRFAFEDAAGEGVRFTVEAFVREANPVDWAAMALLGRVLQWANWRRMVQNVVEESGGRGEVQSEVRVLEGEEARAVERWLEGLAVARARAEHEGQLGAPGG
jgi:NADH dehydrogenase